MWCDLTGTVVETVVAAATCISQPRPGETLTSFAVPGSQEAVGSFLKRLAERGTIFHHLLFAACPGGKGPTAFHLLGHSVGSRILLVGAETTDEVVRTYLKASKAEASDSPIPSFMTIIQALEGGKPTDDGELYDKLSRLNNELVNVQRELAQRNRDLERSLEEIGGLQEQLLKEERDRVLLETAGATAHEINQPLTVLIGLADVLLRSRSTDAADYEDLQRIRNAGKKIEEIVRRMCEVREYEVRDYAGGRKIVDFDKDQKEGSDG